MDIKDLQMLNKWRSKGYGKYLYLKQLRSYFKDDGIKCLVQALSSTVLVVLVLDEKRKEFCSYTDGVIGKNHAKEWVAVYSMGTKLNEKITQAIFEGNIPKDFTYRP